MTDKLPEVSEILPAGAACAQWLAEGDNARAVPFVAFAAGWKARDAEVEELKQLLMEAGDIIAEQVLGVGFYASAGDPEAIVDLIHTRYGGLVRKPQKAARRTGGG